MGKYELTNPQKSIWYTEEVFKGSTVNNICTSGTIYENVDIELLKKAINTVVEYNDSFRIHINIENGVAKQYISDYTAFDIDVEFINDASQLNQIQEKQSKYKFNIIDSDLFKFKIVILQDKFACVILTANHIISDSWSMGLTIQEILRIYNSLKNGEKLEFKTYSYTDYIKSEQEYKTSEKYIKDKKYWEDVFETLPEQASIPSINKNTEGLNYVANRLSFEIDKELLNKINILCKENHFSVFNFFLTIFSVYINQVSNTDDFVIGTPILNRTNQKEKHTTGMFINTAPVRFKNITGTFLNHATLVSKQMMSILRHQRYSYNTILEDLRNKYKNIPNLYNIMISYQITKAFDKKYGNYETSWTFNGTSANDLSIHIYDINDTGNLEISYDYLTEKYITKDIEWLHSRIIHMITQVLENPEILTNEIDIITEEEKNKIIYKFNNNNFDYPKDKTIATLFEEQVKRTPNNIAVVFKDQRLTYKELNEKANSLAYYLKMQENIKPNDLVGIMCNRSLEMIVAILAVLKSGGAYIPIDPTYPKDRIDYMLESSNAKILLTQKHLEDRINFENKLYVDLNNIYSFETKNLENINSPEDLAYVIFTSGSTGKPKGVMLKQRNIINFIYGMMKEFNFSSGSSIACITTISFDIFVLESLMPLLNGLKIVIANEEEQTNVKLFNELCIKNHVNIIQTTPSRMQIFMQDTNSLDFIKNASYILIGGEPFPITLLNNIKKISNAKIYNMYGPTETAVWSSLKDLSDTNIITIGKPIINTQIYILSSNLKPLPIKTPGEIYISGDGVSKGYLNNSELTNKCFITNPFIANNLMYRTGDLGMFDEGGNIICLGRIDSQAKIRGLRIELGEIEEKIKELPYIENSVVIKRTDKNLHEFLCAYYTTKETVESSSIRKHLEKFLPRYMIPTYFMKLDSFPYTPNGKIDKKSLPEPQIDNSSKKVILPRNEIDSKLIGLLKELLNIDNISIDDNFFDLGGDSLSAINLCTQVQSSLNVELFVKDILDYPIIHDLSDIISRKDKASKQILIKPIPKAEYYPVSSSQKRMFYTSQIAGNNSILYNLPGGAIFDGNVNISKLEKCINTIISRHQTLRTYFEIENDVVVQKVLDNINFKLNIVENCNFENIDVYFKDFVKPFDLSKAPLFRAKLIKFTNKKSALFIDMHHIISDGTSLNLFIDELCKLYNGETLPQLKISYKDYAAFESNRLKAGYLKEAENYWLQKYSGDLPLLNMPTNYPRPAVQSFEGKKVYSLVDKETTKLIDTISKKLGITPYMLLLSCYYILLEKYTSQEDIIVGSPIAGRNLDEVRNLIGMFVNTLALRNNVDSSLSFKEFALNIKENILEAFKYQAYPFDELVNKLQLKRNTSRNPLFDTMFIYQNDGYKNISLKDINAEYYIPDTSISKVDLSLEIVPQNGEMHLSFEYAAKLFCEDFIQDLSNHYLNILNSVLENNDIKISEINILSKEEKNKILYDFNNTYADYKRNETIVSLFESQVEKTPNNIAIIFENKELTYIELNEKANSLANYLRTKEKIGRNDLVGIMCNRSLEMIIAILAVLKAGGAYIPIDPTYPKDRVDYMLNSSKAKLLLTQNRLESKIDFEKKLCIDLDDKNLYSFEANNLRHINDPEDLSYVIFTSGSTGLPKAVALKHKALSNLTNYCNNYIEYLKNPTGLSIVSITTISFDIFIFETLISLQKGLKIVIANENEQTSPHLLNNLIKKYNIKIIQSTPSRMQIFVNNITNIPELRNLKYIILAGEQLPLNLVSELTNLCNPVIYNGYGPSETTVFSTLTKMNTDKITIGKPLYNTQIYILDNNLNPVPIGVAGEIYISGDGVGKGYLNNASLTSKSFINNPFIKNSIMYKTGDMGMYNKNGDIICLGRLDHQVKLRGLRIELGEIEDKINELPFINLCVVMKSSDSNLREFLIAYFTANTKIEISTIRKHLEKFLPKYMIPTYFVQVDIFPYTPNGKIDRKKLLKPKIENLNKTIVSSRNDIDSRLIGLLKNILSTDNISIDDDFFELGGDSLSAINLCAQIHSIFNTELFVRDILENPKIQDISDIISKRSNNYKEELIKPVSKSEFYKTSSAQRRIYFAHQMAGENSTLYNISGGIILYGNIDLLKLESCIKIVINRHESFRTYFELEGENVVQKVVDNIDFKLEILDNVDFENIHSIYKDFIRPFDLKTAPLFRAKFVQFTNGKSALFIDMHHIISDGTSLSIFADELSKLYNGDTLPELKLSYKDFASFENNNLNSDLQKEAETYWLKQFETEAPILNMQTSYSRPSTQTFEGKKIYSLIDKSTTKKIQEQSKNLNITSYMLLLSCLYILLSKYTSQDDIVIGSPIAGRDMYQVQNIIGMFVNTLALRNKVDSNLSFKDFLLNIKENILEAYKYQTYPFDKLINKLNIKRDPSRNPLFDVFFVYQNNGYKDLKLKGIKSEYYLPNTDTSKFDLSLEVLPKEEDIYLSFEYATNLFDEEFIKSLSNHYLNILNSVLENKDIKISDICMLSKSEENKILYEFNNTTLQYPKDKTIVDLFEEQVEKSPDNVAVIFEDKRLTYSELNKKANALSNYLISKGITNKNVVGIKLNRSIELIIAIYAVIKSGASYVLIDPSFPEDRINYILNDSDSKYCITNNELANFEFSNYDNQNLNINHSDNLCIIYTSGSTGKPKGVLLHNQGFINLMYAFDKEMEISKFKNILGISTISFDMFAVELFSSTLFGSTLILANEEEQKNPISMSNLIKTHNIDFFVTTPSRVELLLNKECGNPLENIKAFQLGGEKLTSSLYNKLIKYTKAKIYNGYGPTEITACCTNKLLESDDITIGKPISNVQAYICDNNLNLLPIGLIGEICIAGDGVSKGYLNNDTATSKSFIKNPFGDGVLYKTGDLGKYRENGEIEYIGRSDNQIKIRGLRIELGEIENCILKFPNIKKATVIKQTVSNRESLSAYFIANEQIDIYNLRKYLSTLLPLYMVPSYFTQLDSFVYNSNGKLDIKSLPLPKELSNVENYVAPHTEFEKQLVDIWEKLLNIKKVGINDNFFELGGDSLLAMTLNVELLKISDKVKYSYIFQYPTIAELEEKLYSDNNKLMFNKIENLSDNFVDILDNSTEKIKTTKWHPRNVLLTGSTGFLGIHILEQLIKNEHGKIYCVIRDGKKMSAKEKLLEKLNYYFGDKYNNLIDNRILVVTGNISNPSFGLSKKDLLNFIDSIDVVINCAANVSHYGNYTNFYNSNVKSVKYIVDFCKTYSKKLYHISTMSISGSGSDLSLLYNKKNRKKIVLNESRLYVGQILDNVYTRSKFEAENIVLNAIANGLDAYILRMGNLMPRFCDGVFQENIMSNAFISKIIAFINLGIIPDYLLKTKLEFTPVDFAANSIYKILTNPSDKNRIFHLYNHHTISVRKLVRLLKMQHFNAKVLKASDFKLQIENILSNDKSKTLLKNLINDFDKSLNLNYDIDIIIKSNYTIKYLRKIHFKWPRINYSYLIRFINLLRKVI